VHNSEAPTYLAPSHPIKHDVCIDVLWSPVKGSHNRKQEGIMVK